MAVINLERIAVERLAREMAPAFRQKSLITARVAELDNVERWRKAARRAGRLLGFPVRTSLSPDGTRVWAVLDQPVSEGEMTRAVNLVAALVRTEA